MVYQIPPIVPVFLLILLHLSLSYQLSVPFAHSFSLSREEVFLPLSRSNHALQLLFAALYIFALIIGVNVIIFCRMSPCRGVFARILHASSDASTIGARRRGRVEGVRDWRKDILFLCGWVGWCVGEEGRMEEVDWRREEGNDWVSWGRGA